MSELHSPGVQGFDWQVCDQCSEVVTLWIIDDLTYENVCFSCVSIRQIEDILAQL